MANAPGCPAHPLEPGIAVCASCDRDLCDECFGQTVDGKAWCDDCVALLRRPVPPIVPVAGVAVSALLAVLVTGTVADGAVRWPIVAGATLVSSLAAWRLARRRAPLAIAARAPGPPRVPSSHHPYRGALRRARKRIAPPASGPVAVAVVSAALALAAAVAPAALRLPRWIELEIVVLLWWGILSIALASLLFRGWRIARDHQALAPSIDTSVPRSALSVDGCTDLEGGLLIVVLVLALLAGQLAIELVVLPVLFGGYLLLLAALGRVANDRHRCAGRPLRAAGWGVFWATVYTVPCAALVWLVKAVAS